MNKEKSMASLINRRLILVTITSSLLASILSAMYTLAEFNFSIKPEILKKTNAVSQVIHDDVELAIISGVPLDRIRGMDAYLSETLEKYPELTFIAVVSKDNKPLYSAGELLSLNSAQDMGKGAETISYFSASLFDRLELIKEELFGFIPAFSNESQSKDVYEMNINYQDSRVGGVFVGLNSNFIRSQLADMFFDIVIVLVAVLLVCFEVVMVVVMFYISGPLEESKSILKRQVDGDFSIKDSVPSRGSIGHFIAKLNDDSKDLQGKFVKTCISVSEENTDEVKIEEKKTRLQKIAERFNLQTKLGMKNGDILDARIPLFVFSFAEELQKSFMPLFVSEFYEPNQWISRDVMLGLPISVFMLVIAVSTPFFAKWVDKFGQKPLFLMGLIPAIAGYLGCAFAQDSMGIVISRGITAFGYALITISCQSYIAAVVSSENRAKGMAIFVGVLMTATMCGTALGAIIADRIGYQPVFLISAVLASFSGLLAWRMFSGSVSVEPKKVSANGESGLWSLAKNVKFVSLVICCAIPAKIVLTGFLYFMVPLYLVSLEASQSEIGRIMMIYSLIIIPLSPIASGIADRTKKMKELVVLGTLLSGGILISLYGEASFFKVLLAVALMGVAHSILKAPLIASALEAAEDTPEVGKTTVLSTLRTSERIGGVLGPVIVAVLLAFYDFGETMMVIGIGIVLSGVMMMLFLRKSENAVEEVAP
ncbi:MFS transporter [Marinomonas sp. 2405UD68-3]|uniref:MFS transporter n=1 Tax=Marinomonas sp. 2405UD68-3 TaxID=3391835 RepID=UPI0039C943C7